MGELRIIRLALLGIGTVGGGVYEDRKSVV